MDASAIMAWLAAQTKGDKVPSIKLVADALSGLRALSRFDGFNSCPLELTFDFADIVVFQVIGRFVQDGAINTESMNADATQIAEIVDQYLAIVALIPRVVSDSSVQVVSICNAAVELMNSSKDIVLRQPAQIASMNLFALEVTTKRGNTKLGRLRKHLKRLG